MTITSSVPLIRCSPRSPWYHARTRTTAGRDEREGEDLLNMLAASRRCREVFEALQEPPGGGDVDQPPLDHLAASQPCPGALGPRSAGVSVTSKLRQLERRILRTRGQAGTLSRHVALDVGEDGFEFGVVPNGGESGIESR